MGLFLTLLYILTAYLGPQTLWGPLYEFHIEIILAALALITSASRFQDSKIFTIPQSYALIGMCVAVFCSMVMTGWLGSVMPALLGFIPNAFTFFLVVLNVRTKRHLQLLTLTMLLFCTYPIYKGYTALRAEDYTSPYLLIQGLDGGGGVFYRLRGLAFINDPNDFAQVLVSLIPCMFLLWKKGNIPRNILFVLLPISWLIFGMFLTHSRGGMLALLTIILFASRRKIGTVPAVILAVGLFAVTSVVGWSGGRDVSMEAGEGRMEAWAVGLDLIKAHPLFGVGFGRFGEYFFVTAHNTVVVCTAELGLFGFFWWVMFVLPTVRDAAANTLLNKSKPAEEDEEFSYARSTGVARQTSSNLQWRQPQYAAAEIADSSVMVEEFALSAPHPSAPLHLGLQSEEILVPEPDEIQRLARVMLTCLVGYLVAGWFLSRAYIMTLFIYGGMVQAVYFMAIARGIAPPRMKPFRVIQLSIAGSLGLLFVVYLMLRFQHAAS
jgi:O-antigen ligase